MKIEIAQPPSSATVATTGTSTTRTGAVIEIAVIRDAITGNLLLRHGNAVYLPRPGIPLEEGEHWRARVLQTEPYLILEVQDDRPEAMARIALRKHVAAQRGMARLLALVAASEKRTLEPDADTRERLALVGAALPARSLLLGGQGLRTAVRASGLWFEAHLVEARPLQHDLKASLIRAMRGLPRRTADPAADNPPPPLPDTPVRPQAAATPPRRMDSAQLREHFAAELEGVLARLTMSQAVALLGGGAHWHIELPFRDAEGPRILEMRIDAEAGDDDLPVWRISLALHSTRLGGVSVSATLHGDSVSVSGHTEKAAAGELLDRGQALLKHGIELMGAHLVRCRMDISAPPAAPQAPASLLDLKA